MLLAPTLTRVLGRINSWAPKSLARLHDRLGFSDSVGRVSGSENERADRRRRAIARRVLFGQEKQRQVGSRD